jgi:spermidine synthase
MTATAEPQSLSRAGRHLAGARVGFFLPTGLLVASGMASLIFQVIWIKQLTLIVGVEVHAVATVVAAFFAGLALGSLVWGRVADRIARPLRLYGIVEFAAALLGLGTAHILASSAPLFARLEDTNTILAWALPIAAVAIPAFLMGGTLPALVRFLSASGDIGRIGGRLYAANTMGAVFGALLPPFLLIPSFGVLGTAMSAATIGVVAGTVALFSDLRLRPGAKIPTARVESNHATASTGNRAALTLYGAAGGVALGYEIVWTQAIVPYMSTRAFAFSIVLATYLVGLAIGAALYARFAGRTREPWGAFGLLIAAAGLAALLGVVALGRWLILAQSGAEASVLALTGSSLAGISARFVVAASAVVLLPTLLLGAAFPAVLRLTGSADRPGGAVGAVVAVNTLGGILGTTLTGFVLIPSFGLLRTLGILAVIAALIGLAALWRGGVGGKLRLTVTGLAVAALAVAILVPYDRLASVLQRSEGTTLAFYEEGRGGTVAVIEQGQEPKRFHRLYIQGVSNSGDAMPSLRYMRLQSLLPLILHNGEPRSALVIGYGTGITAGALLRDPALDKRVVAELLPAVLRAGPLFEGTFGAATDPRLEIRLRDGRRELQRSDEHYDLITLEPPPPSAAGVVNLYSSDFYRLAASRLESKGIVAQWLPLPTQNEDDTRSLVRSFLDVFPHASLWTTELHEMLLVGSLAPVALDWPTIRERFARPDTASALAEVGVATPEALIATFVMDRDGLETFVGDAEAVTDDRPRIEYADWVRGRDFGSVLPDLLNLRTEPPLQNADPSTLAAIDARRVELLTFYHAGMAAYAGDQPAWAADMRDVLAADPENPYYRWFATRAAE